MRRPVVFGIPKPLAPSDPVEWWADEAARLGLTVEELREQIRISDEIMEELLLEEKMA